MEIILHLFFIRFCRLYELKAFCKIFIFFKKFVHFISSYISTFLRHYSLRPALKQFLLEYLMLSYRVLNPSVVDHLYCACKLFCVILELLHLLLSLTLRCIHTSFLVNRSILNRCAEFQPCFSR